MPDPIHLRPVRSLVIALGSLFLASHAGADSPIQYAAPIKACRLENRKVNESSGLAASRRSPNTFWTHNDSGDHANIYCFDSKGNDLGSCRIKGAKAVDWEDMCSYDYQGQPRLMVGDTGDNQSRRKSARLYILQEPQLGILQVKPLQTIKLKYSTGAMDCEAIGVDAVNKKILLVEKKRWLTCRVFMADLPGEHDDEVKITARPIAQIELPLVTAMDVSADGLRAIVLTLGQAFEYTRNPTEDWAAAFQRKPRTINMPARKQGEAICYGKQGRDLYLTSEFSPCPLFYVKAKSPSVGKQ